MKRVHLIAILLFASTSSASQGILDNYDTNTLKMECFNENSGWVNWGVRGKNIVGPFGDLIAILEQKENVYAAKEEVEMDGVIITATTIVDFDTRIVIVRWNNSIQTMNVEIVYDC